MGLIDLTGQTFGYWTVIEQDKEKSRERNKAYWICQCKCGTVRSVNSYDLRKGVSTSCGCKKIKDLTGKKFELLEVLELDTSKHERDAYWLCKCHGCGNIVSIDSQQLKRYKSCGCKRYDLVSEKQSAHLEGQVFGYLKVLERDTSKPRGRDAYWICECTNCGNITSIRTYDLQHNIRSCGCMNSKGELSLKLLFKSMNIKYVSQYNFQDLRGDKHPLRFDFYLPEYNILIEYQGSQHYAPQKHFGGEEQFNIQQEHDQAKRDYCKEHNIPLIEIPYTDYHLLNEDYMNNLLQSYAKETSNA